MKSQVFLLTKDVGFILIILTTDNSDKGLEEQQVDGVTEKASL
jgi:hypothetical protein